MPKRAILFANGDFHTFGDPGDLITEEDYLVAVDGGLRHLETLGVIPDLLIGDLDSVTPAQLERLSGGKTRVLKFPVEKDETDLELALLEMTRRDMKEIIILGALGGRIDQTLANIFLLALPELADLDVRILTRDEEIFLIHKATTIHGSKGDLVSLIAFNGDVVGVITSGLQFPLKAETLRFNRSRGISNRMLAETAEVRVREGALLCIHSRNPDKERDE